MVDKKRMVEFPVTFSPAAEWEASQLEKFKDALAEASLDALCIIICRPQDEHPHVTAKALREAARAALHLHDLHEKGAVNAVSGYALTLAAQYATLREMKSSGGSAFLSSCGQKDLVQALVKLPPSALTALREVEPSEEEWWANHYRGALAVAKVIEAGHQSEASFALPSATDDIRYKADLFVRIGGRASALFQVKGASAEAAGFSILECEPSMNKGRQDANTHVRKAVFEGAQRLNAAYGTAFIPVILRVHIPDADNLMGIAPLQRMMQDIIAKLSPAKKTAGRRSEPKNPDPTPEVKDES